MVAIVELLSSVAQCLHLTQYFPFSLGTFKTKECCLMLGLIFPDILNLPSNLFLNVCFVFMYFTTNPQ